MTTIYSSNLGYPRIGEHREWKKALEAYWKKELDEASLKKEMTRLRLEHLRKQKEAGIDWIPVGDFTLYDQMLDMTHMFGLIPERFLKQETASELEIYFSMARGNQHAVACDMTKWFNTNYHYIVPEWEGQPPTLTENRPLKSYLEAKNELGIDGKPVIIGPYTYTRLSKGTQGTPEEWFEQLVPVYAKMLRELEEAGCRMVQMDEPAMVTSQFKKEDIPQVERAYQAFAAAAPNIQLILQTYFDFPEHYEALVRLPVQGIGLDFSAAREPNLKRIKEYGFPEEKTLAIGLINGRNIWRTDLPNAAALAEELLREVSPSSLIVQPSCSLMHVPVSVRFETKLEPELKRALAFADEKLKETVSVARYIHSVFESRTPDPEIEEAFSESREAFRQFSGWSERFSPDVQSRVNEAKQQTFRRTDFAERRKLQQQKWNLPPLPTTTIGSLPQTQEVRRMRRDFKKGTISKKTYEQFIQDKIREWTAVQEELGLDVLVHGEFERNDMVEYFGERMRGFSFTENGWVQSYGSRCVKPPVLYGDVDIDEPMTVKEIAFAQTLTDKPVKGMLTGPVTIMNWSFVRDDIPWNDSAFQIALALQKEISYLEQEGIEMIQVDEPALREGLPLKRERWQAYLSDAVKAFRMATSRVKDTTQIHTHMCYSEFQDIIESIDDLDADVISIENSRSHGDLIRVFETHAYRKEIGLGVYDIHSPRIPEVDEMVRIIERAIDVIDARLFWINPDCGLKTRGEKETVAALKNMVQAAEKVRERLSVPR